MAQSSRKNPLFTSSAQREESSLPFSPARLDHYRTEASGGGSRFGYILLGSALIVLLVAAFMYMTRRPESLAPSESTSKPSLLERIFGDRDDEPGADDADSDGLSDAEERELGTDPNRADTDGDGLTDREEIKVYGTDPRQTDTDGDSIADGSEIKGRTDPRDPSPQAIWPPVPEGIAAGR